MKNSKGRPKKCSAVLCFKPKSEKITIIEEKLNKKGKTVFKIDPQTPDEELFKPENYDIYHNHKGEGKFESSNMVNQTDFQKLAAKHSMNLVFAMLYAISIFVSILKQARTQSIDQFNVKQDVISILELKIIQQKRIKISLMMLCVKFQF